MLQTVAEFRAQASRLRKAELRYLDDLKAISPPTADTTEQKRHSARRAEEAPDDFMKNWQEEWSEWKSTLNAFKSERPTKTKKLAREKETNKGTKKTDGKRLKEASNDAKKTITKDQRKNAMNEDKRMGGDVPSSGQIDLDSARLLFLEQSAEEFSRSLLGLLENFQDLSVKKQPKRMLDRGATFFNFRLIHPVQVNAKGNHCSCIFHQ